MLQCICFTHISIVKFYFVRDVDDDSGSGRQAQQPPVQVPQAAGGMQQGTGGNVVNPVAPASSAIQTAVNPTAAVPSMQPSLGATAMPPPAQPVAPSTIPAFVQPAAPAPAIQPVVPQTTNPTAPPPTSSASGLPV